ncbi:MAG TPA: A/G-specific adenine glycosylase [Streptosporangiaceae bacterium]|nr:A/G-specific adenine glycosylase [Streptosporangiaceae bacterium]
MTLEFERPVVAWFTAHGRDLPWRQPGVSSWAVLVSEFMLQQTPVGRVLPAYQAWLDRWPAAASLACATPADAVRQWDRLGYPRRALRLHDSARVIASRHGGEVPRSVPELLELPGVGSYTAAAVASFAFGQRHAVLDTNVRRVLARLVSGRQFPASSVSVAETALAQSLLPPAADRRAARWSVALMELGALVCTATRPACEACPVADGCAWRRGGSPPSLPPRRSKPYSGSDRQCRGRLLAALRQADAPVLAGVIAPDWPDVRQRERMLTALVADGLAVRFGGDLLGLPGDRPPGDPDTTGSAWPA